MSLMPSQVKRSIYSPEFKIKVLEHYLKNGGESVFGLKSKTAAHFKIGKKTVHRIVESKRELLAVKARKARKAAAVAKLKSTVEKSVPVTSKAASASPKQQTLNSSSQAKASTGKNVPSKSLPSKTVASKTLQSGKSVVTNAKTFETSHSSKRDTPDRTFNSPIRLKENYSLPQTSSKNNSSKNEEILELPEDPDFSVLKPPIAGGVNAPGLAGPAILLSSATQEVRDALVFECDIIYECKVCRNLFRSIVNFLAHKRIFCQSSYVTNKGVYSQGAMPTFLPHSSTVFSEAEAPDDAGTSQYFERLQKKDKLLSDVSKDCSVVLQDIKGVSGAVFQNITHPDAVEENTHLDQARDLIREHETGVTAVLNEDGYISTIIPNGKEPVSITESGASPSLEVQDDCEWVDETEMFEDEENDNEEDKGQNQRLGQELDLTCSECDRVFSGRKSLRAHLSKIHGAQRTIYTCPLSNCNNKFLSVWATGKHLQRTHKKSRLQVDNLRNTIKKNSYQQDNVKTLQGQVVKSGDSTATRLLDNVKQERDEQQVTSTQLPRCQYCSMFFVTEKSLSTHLALYCTSALNMLQSDARLLSPKDRSKPSLIPPRNSPPPSKRIGIQIRKVYKSELNESRRAAVEKTSNGDKNEGEWRDSSNNNFVSVKKRMSFPKSEGPMAMPDIEERMKSFCDLKDYMCMLCNKKFYSYTNIRRHAAIHMNWTRFSCLLCGFRTYHKFLMIKHASSDHDLSEIGLDSCFEMAHYLNGAFKNDLSLDAGNTPTKTTSNEENKTVEPLQMVDVLVEEIVQTEKPDDDIRLVAPKNTRSVDATNSDEDDLAKDSTKEESKEKTSTKTVETEHLFQPKTMKLKLKKVNIQNLTAIKIKEEFDAFDDGETVPSQVTLDVEEERDDEGNSAADEDRAPGSASSVAAREKRVTRLPAKRKFPDSPQTFTGSNVKKMSPTDKNKSKKMKINITSLTTKKSIEKSE